MDYKKVERDVQSLYNNVYSRGYKESDLAESREPFHKEITKKLHEITASFPQPIDVLDIGCGTGRYFYSLVQVHTLTGIDVSQDMLIEAKHPIREDEIMASAINLVCGDVFQHAFPDESFDFIYSIGVLGEHSPFDETVCKKIYHILRPKGKALITVVDAQSMWKRRLAEILYPVLPKSIKEKLHYRRKSFYMYRVQLEALLQRSEFDRYDIVRTVSKSPKWKGSHFECVLTKN